MKLLYLKYYLVFFTTNILLYYIGLKLIPVLNIGMNIIQLQNAFIYFSLVSFLSLSIFIIGQKKENSTAYTFLSYVLKFLLYMIFIAVFYFFNGKKLNLEFLFSFFSFYMANTLILIIIFDRFLKLKKD